MKRDTPSLLSDSDIQLAKLEIETNECEREVKGGLLILEATSPEVAERLNRLRMEPLTRSLEESIINGLRTLEDIDMLQFGLNLMSKMRDLQTLRDCHLAFT